MNKQEYLDLLRYYLKELPQVVIDDIVYDYEEHFNIGLADGKTEEDISKELGSPKTFAEDFLAGEKKRNYFNDEPSLGQSRQQEKQSKNNKSNIILWIILIILLFPVIISVIGGLFGIVMGMFGLSIALFVLGGALFLGFLGFGSLSSILHSVTLLFSSIFVIALGILLVYAAIKFIKWLWKAAKNTYLSIKWRMEVNPNET